MTELEVRPLRGEERPTFEQSPDRGPAESFGPEITIRNFGADHSGDCACWPCVVRAIVEAAVWSAAWRERQRGAAA